MYRYIQMSPMNKEPIGTRGSPFAVGIFALVAAALAAALYGIHGSWHADLSAVSTAFLVLLGTGLMVYAWRFE